MPRTARRRKLVVGSRGRASWPPALSAALLAAFALAFPARAHPPAALPAHFEENVGQLAADVAFVARLDGPVAVVRGREVEIRSRDRPRPSAPAVPGGAWRLRFRLGMASEDPMAMAVPAAVGVDQLPGVSTTFRGGPGGLRRTVARRFAALELREVYPGVDARLTADGSSLQVDFALDQAAAANAIALELETSEAEEPVAAADGSLSWGGDGGHLRLGAPKAFVAADGGCLREVAVALERRGSRFGFCLDADLASGPAVIDPTLDFATYLGGSDLEESRAVAIDDAGFLYVAGSTYSPDFPIVGGVKSTVGRSDAFVVKLDPSGRSIVYATYLGGASLGKDIGTGIAVDRDGNAYLTGVTESSDFPVVRAMQPAYRASGDGFVAKLSPAGDALLYSTYLGGVGVEFVYGIAADWRGTATVAGLTRSPDFPVVNAAQPAYGGISDAFVTRLASDGRLVYSTYLGGSDIESATAVAVDPSGRAIVVGTTESADFPLVRAVQTEMGGGPNEGFVAKLAADGAALVYATYLGGSDADYLDAVASDRAGAAYVTGNTWSLDFPLSAPFQGRPGTLPDGFLVKLEGDGSALAYSTYLGGNGADWALGVAAGFTGEATVIGYGTSTDLPLAAPVQPAPGGSDDAFILRLTPAGDALLFGTYLGGAGKEYGIAVALDASEDAFVAGYTDSADFPVVAALQPVSAGGQDVFLARLGPADCARPGSAGNTVKLRREGADAAWVYWVDVADATLYDLLEDARAYGPFLLAAGTGTDGARGALWAPPGGRIQFLRVAARNNCGLGPR